MGKHLNRWARSASALVAIIGLAGFATADKATVEFNVPDGWTTKDIPSEAEQVDVAGKKLELEQNSAYRQTLTSGDANVAEVIGNSGSACSIYGVNNGAAGNGTGDTVLKRDVWLKVSGGTYSAVVGGSNNYWNKNNATTPLNGNIFVELAGSGTAVTGNLIGAIEEGSWNKTTGNEVGMEGDVLVVVSGGATVSGSVLGGATSKDGHHPTITGTTKVRILSLLSGGNRVLGGSMYIANGNNTGSSVTQVGTTAVEVKLGESIAGTFAKEIAGGSYTSGAGDFAITGSTSVSISAPNAVTFSSPIYGASVSASSSADGSVSGDSSTTINGGTYTKSIYAAGYGKKAVVAGKATLTLKAGVFSGATLGVGASGATAGDSELVIAGTEAIDLSETTIGTDFKTLKLLGDLILGTQRTTIFPTIMAVGAERTISITLTEAEQKAKRVVFGKTSVVPANLAVTATDTTGAPVEGWSLWISANTLVYAPTPSERTWVKPESGTDWSAGLSGFVEGDNVTFGWNSAQESVTLPATDVRVEKLNVEGKYAFEGTGGVLSATDVSLAYKSVLALNDTSATAPETLLSISNKLTVSGELSGTAAITASTVAITSGGILSGTPTITADTITLTEGSTIKVNTTGVATLIGTVSGEARILLESSSAIPETATPFPVLKAPEGLTLTPPEGYELAAYVDGYYRMYRKPPTWTAGGEPSQWANIDLWTNLAVADEVPTEGNVEVNFGSDNIPATLTIDAKVTLDTLLVRGSAGGEIELGETCSLTAKKLIAETDLTIPVVALPADATILDGTTLTLTGDGSLTTAFSDAVNLVIADGTVKLEDGVDLSSLKKITIYEGATLDFNGKTFQSTPITLDGGTIANSSSTNAVTGAVTLNADSFVEATNGEVHFNVPNKARNDLVLNGHKLTKTGSKLFKVCDVDVDEGTIRVEKGALQLDNTGADSTMANTTLSFAKEASYEPDGWVRTKSGTVTLDADEGANIVFYNSSQQAHLKGDCNLVKTGQGTITVPFRSDSLWGGTLTVNGGTLDLYKTTTDAATFSKNVTVADGATLRKSGLTGKVTISGQLQKGGGTIEVATGEVVPSAANGYFYGNWKIASGAKVSSTERRYWQLSSGGTVEVNGELVLNVSSSNYDDIAFASKITGSGTVRINQNMMMWGSIESTGKIVVASGKKVYGMKSGTETYLSISGADLECNGTITGAGGSITIPAGKTLSGTGTIESAVTLGAGAVLGVSTATASSHLTLSGTVKGEGNVSVVLPESPSAGLQLVKWSATPAGATYTASTTLPQFSLLARPTGLYYAEMSIDDTKPAGTDGTIATLSETAQRALAGMAFDAGATSIASVLGTQGGSELSSEALNGALSCFELTPSVTLEGEVATITIAYDFGISGMSAVMKDGAPVATVKAKIENGNVAAFLADGAEIILQSKEKTATDDSWAEVEGATFARNGDIYEAKVSLSDVSNKTFRVLARTKN